MEKSHRTPSRGRGLIQKVLKDASIEGKRILKVIEANKKRAAVASEDRERLAELFRLELRPPARSANNKIQRYWQSACDSWIDLKLAEARNSSPYILSNIRTRAERYRQRYDDLMGQIERKDVDEKLAASFKFNEFLRINLR